MARSSSPASNGSATADGTNLRRLPLQRRRDQRRLVQRRNVVIQKPAGKVAAATGIALQADGKIVALGGVTANPSAWKISASRLHWPARRGQQLQRHRAGHRQLHGAPTAPAIAVRNARRIAEDRHLRIDWIQRQHRDRPLQPQRHARHQLQHDWQGDDPRHLLRPCRRRAHAGARDSEPDRAVQEQHPCRGRRYLRQPDPRQCRWQQRHAQCHARSGVGQRRRSITNDVPGMVEHGRHGL